MKIPTLVHSIETIVHHDGNGAREALTEIEMTVYPIRIQAAAGPGVSWADWLLLELAARGFQVVPIEEKDLSWP